MSEEDERLWPIILAWMYEQRMSIGGLERTERDEEVQIRRIRIVLENKKGEEIDRQIVRDTLEYMADIGLLKMVAYKTESPEYGEIYGLSKMGFEVAHQRQLREEQVERERRAEQRHHEINRGIAFLTLGLVFIGAVQAVVTAFDQVKTFQLPTQGLPSWTGANISILAALVGVIGVIVMGIFLRYEGMLTSWNSGEQD